MDKRGSHVGMILSFVLFVTALILLYDIMRPISLTNDEKEKLIEQVKMSLEKKLQRELFTSTISPRFEKNFDKGCVYLNYSTLEENLSNEHIVKGVSGEIIGSNISGENINIENVSKPFRIFFAKGLKNENFNIPKEMCKEAKYRDTKQNKKPDYNFTTSKKDYYFEEDLITFLEELEVKENYSRIKEEFLLPKDAEFNIIWTLQNKTRFGEEKNVSGTNVFVNQYPISYINSSADVNSGFFDIFVW